MVGEGDGTQNSRSLCLSPSLSPSLSVSLPSVLSVWVMRCVGLMNKLLMLKCSDLSKGKFEQGADDRRMKGWSSLDPSATKTKTYPCQTQLGLGSKEDSKRGKRRKACPYLFGHIASRGTCVWSPFLHRILSAPAILAGGLVCSLNRTKLSRYKSCNRN